VIGLPVTVLFAGSAIDRVSRRDWDLLRVVLCVGVCLAVALASLPLAAWVILKLLGRLRGRPPKPGRIMSLSPLSSANSRRRLCFRQLREIQDSLASSGGSAAAVDEGGRSAR